MPRLAHLAFLLGLAWPGFADTDADTDNSAAVRAGESLYVQCTGCHAPDYNRTGPRHCGLLGRAAGSLENFVFTPAMRSSGIIWTAESLDDFLQAPLRKVPGTSMAFAGLSLAEERQQVIAYLATLTPDNPVCR